MFIDTNIHLGSWPFRHLPHSSPAGLMARLKALGVTQAWAGSFEAPFHRDLFGVNERLATACHEAGGGFFLPFGSVNPRLPDWQEDLRRAHEVLKLTGLRLYPSYHGYKLDHPDLVRLLESAAQRGMPVQIALKLEDERTQNPLMPILATDPTPLVTIVAKFPGLRLQILNASLALGDNLLIPLARAGRVILDIAMIEGVGGVSTLADRVGLERVAYGSHAPFFAAESSRLKLKEADLTPDDQAAIRSGNAKLWLEAGKPQ